MGGEPPPALKQGQWHRGSRLAIAHHGAQHRGGLCVGEYALADRAEVRFLGAYEADVAFLIDEVDRAVAAELFLNVARPEQELSLVVQGAALDPAPDHLGGYRASADRKSVV